MNYARFFLVPVLCLLGCNAKSPDAQVKITPSDIVTETAITEITYETNSKKLGPVHVGMTGTEVEALEFQFDKKIKNIEGDEYVIYLLHFSDNTDLKCTLDLHGRVYSIETLSRTVRDSFGNGVSSSIEDLKTAYPSGRFIYGFADGRYANFVTGTPLIFFFDPKLLSDNCFQTGSQCDLPKNIGVEKIQVGLHSPK